MVISKRAGQGGNSSVANMLAAMYANMLKSVLVIPLAEDLIDYRNWYRLDDEEKNIKIKINTLYDLLQSNKLTHANIAAASTPIRKKMAMLDMRSKVLTPENILRFLQYVIKEFSFEQEAESNKKFDVIIYDYHYDNRSEHFKQELLDKCDIIIEVVSPNNCIYSNSEDWLDEWRYKTIRVENMYRGKYKKENFFTKFLKKFNNVNPKIVYDFNVIKDQNNRDFNGWFDEMLIQPTIKQMQIRSTLENIIEEVYKLCSTL